MTQSGGCRQFRRQQRWSRRSLLSVGAATALGLTLPDLLQLREAPAAKAESGSFGSARHVIFIFLHGGNPQHETWDPKTLAPAEVRGEFGDTPTVVPGLRISELFPQCAKIADRLAIVRSMSHDDTNHVQACLPAMTGHKHPPQVRNRGDFPPSREDFPHFGAVLDHLRGGGGALPNWVQIGPRMTRNNGTVLHGQAAGFLGRAHSPLVVDQDLSPRDVRIEAIAPQIEVGRLKDRRRLLAQLESDRRRLDQRGAHARETFHRRAYNLLTSDKTRRAFDLAAEPVGVRRLYPDSQVGQSCLLARRLVEAGVPFVNVHYCKTPKGSWDTHSNNFSSMKQSLAPTLDGSLSTLIVDLQQRGLLDETLVVAMAEFGRTPQINSRAGRDHWPFVYSLALAGAGLKRGVAHGRSDRLGAYPQSQPYDPADMAATIYHLLGIAPDTTLHDAANRQLRLVAGKRIDAILA